MWLKTNHCLIKTTAVTLGLFASFSVTLAHRAMTAQVTPSVDIPKIDAPVSSNADLAYSNCGLGRIGVMQKDLQNALKHFSECIKYSPPGYFDGYSYRSQVYLQLARDSKDKTEQIERYKKAIADLTYLIGHSNPDEHTYERRGHAFAAIGDTQSALADLRNANELYRQKNGSFDTSLDYEIKQLENEAKPKPNYSKFRAN